MCAILFALVLASLPCGAVTPAAAGLCDTEPSSTAAEECCFDKCNGGQGCYRTCIKDWCAVHPSACKDPQSAKALADAFAKLAARKKPRKVPAKRAVLGRGAGLCDGEPGGEARDNCCFDKCGGDSICIRNCIQSWCDKHPGSCGPLSSRAALEDAVRKLVARRKTTPRVRPPAGSAPPARRRAARRRGGS
jgi:hypothetical protein